MSEGGFCVKCGAALGAEAKFCVRCGASRPTAPTTDQTPVVAATDAAPNAPTGNRAVPATATALAGAGTQAVQPPHRNRRAWWIAGVVILVLAAGIGGFVVAQSGNDRGGQVAVTTTTTTTPPHRSTTTTRTLPFAREAQPARALVPISVTASSTRPTTSDACTPPNPTTFDALNVQDDRPDSAWMPVEGDPRPSVTFRFASPVQVSELQLVDGYPKQDPCRPDINRFYQFMRPTLVSVDLNDRSAPRQLAITDTPTRQTLFVRGTTDQITLTILQSNPPDDSRILPGTQIPFSIPALAEVAFKGSALGG